METQLLTSTVSLVCIVANIVVFSHSLLLGSNKTSECEWMFGCGLVAVPLLWPGAAGGPDVAHRHQYECGVSEWCTLGATL